MPLDLTNLTQSVVNVPFNSGGKPVYVVSPSQKVRVSDEYLLALTPEAQARLVSVTSGPTPLFLAVVVGSDEPPPEVLTPEEKDLLALGLPLVETPEDEPVIPPEFRRKRKGRR